MNLDDYTLKNATHRLSCAHQMCRNPKTYYSMPCNIVKQMPGHRLKIVVYGLLWNPRQGKRIRYVDAYRVRDIKPSTDGGNHEGRPKFG